MYTDFNYRTKKALKQAVRDGKRVTVYQPGIGTVQTDGTAYLEGPHYPEPHTWYAEVKLADGIIVKVS